ncbi:MAG: non-canonical purine NTP pyrophosphatase, partial [Candidatus Omnitrophica bacterium]|nr:non-canonical purine NTP pyrophosphatase [Candidatus Omnitrophota bacterium]
MRRELVVATRNRKKLEEIKEILRGVPLAIKSLADFSRVPAIRENGSTFSDNAIKKAVKAARFTGTLALGEDSGLCVRALNGAPGVRSARYSGRDKNDEKNNRKLLAALEGLPVKPRGAYYACAVALADREGLIGVVEGRRAG